MKWILYISSALALAGAAAFGSGPTPVPEFTQVAHLPVAVSDSDFYEDGAPSEAKVELGRLLFFDKVLSGNRNISCATCHHPDFATSDGLPLGLGEGGEGLGTDRRASADPESAFHGRIPRNSPALFNIGAEEYTVFFHDGRVEIDTAGFYEGGFITPAKWKFPTGLENVLAAQAMFPVGSPEEMAGQRGENPIADAVALNNMAGPGGVWEILGQRLREIPEYVELFQAAFPDRVQDASDVTFVDAANAIAAFEAVAFRSDDAAFDAYLRGDAGALNDDERRGMELFYGEAGCSSCHTGVFQTDHGFHAIAMPQIGPGKGDGSDTEYWRSTGERAFVEDLGRGRVTVRPEDDFKFRTPSLRNVERTGPWGHSGAYATLEAVVRHHLDPVAAVESYTLEPGYLPELGPVLETTMSGSTIRHRILSPTRLEAYMQRDGWVSSREGLVHRIAEANELEPRELSDADVGALLAFLGALTDRGVDELDRFEPRRVPSGLPVGH